MRYIQILISLSLVIYFITKLEIEKIDGIISESEPAFLLISIGICFLQIIFSAYRWRSIGNQLKIEASSKDYLATTWIAGFVSQLTPSSLFGDSYRFHRFGKKNSWTTVVHSLLLDKLSNIVLCCFLLAVLLPHNSDFFINLFSDNKSQAGQASFFDLSNSLQLWGLILFGVAAIWLGSKKFPEYRAYLFPNLSDLRKNCHYLWSLMMLFSMPLQFYFCSEAVGAEIPFAVILTLYPFVMITLVLPISLAGWGVREVGIVSVFGAYSNSPEVLYSISILIGLTTAVSMLPALLVRFSNLNMLKYQGKNDNLDSSVKKSRHLLESS